MPAEEDSVSQTWPVSASCGELKIHIWHHTISGYVGQIDCWTYLSEGMRRVNQPELVITLRRRPSEPEHEYPLEPFEWFKMVYTLGEKGRIIDAYHTHEGQSENWLGSKNLEIITHGMPIEIPGFGPGFFPPIRLHGIALTKGEADIAKVFGYTRVIGHYGISQRWFPYCPWIDRDRDDCISMAQMENSMRSREFPCKTIRGLSARWEGDYIILTIPLGRELEVKAVVEQTSPEEAWALDSSLHPNADCCLYWQTGQNQMSLFSACQDLCCKGLAFLVFCPQQSEDNWNILEDGSTLFLRDSTWLSIREALMSGHDITTPIGNITFCIEFLSDKFNDPGTGLGLSATGGIYKRWFPKKAGWLKDSHVKFEKIMVRDEPGPDPTAKSEIVDYMERIGEVVEALTPKDDPGTGKRLIVVRFELPQMNNEWLNLRVSPDQDGLDIKALLDALMNLPKPSVQEYTMLQIFFGVWG